MKVGDLVEWRSHLMKGYPDEIPLIVLDLNPPSTLGISSAVVVRVVSIPSGWTRTIDVDELKIISSQDH
jgi:hypothetical protein